MLKIEEIITGEKNDSGAYGFDLIQLSVSSLSDSEESILKRTVAKFVTKCSIISKREISSINLTCITKRGLRSVCRLLESPKITWVEIVKDIPYLEDSNDEDTFPVGNILVKEIGDYLTKEFGLKYVLEEENGTCTLYFNFSSIFKFVLYPRLSKRKHHPVIHMEFRLSESWYIKSKIGVRSLTGLRELSVKKTFLFLYTEQTKSEIDFIKVGNFFLNQQHNNTKLVECKTMSELRKVGANRSRAYVEAHGRQICEIYELETPEYVRQYCLSLKQSDFDISRQKGNAISLKTRGYFSA